MNGQNPSNQTNNQNNINGGIGLDPSVLGSVQTPASVGPLPDVPVEPSTPMAEPSVPQTPEVTPVNVEVVQQVQEPVVNPTPTVTEQVAAPVPEVPTNVVPEQPAVMPQPQPIPGTTPMNNPTPNLGIDPSNVVNSNGFVEPKKAENIGTMPPNDDNKKKPAMSKPIFIMLIIALMALVAFGVYKFLSMSKDKVNVSLNNNVTVAVGGTLSTNINDYATITGTDSANCTLVTSNVDTSKIGEYNFTITCESKSYTGKVNVVDNSAPDVELKIVYKTVNSTVTIDDFIESCEDPSECKTELVNVATVNNYLTTTGGPYNIEINSSDKLNNKETLHGVMYVVPYEIKAFLACSSTAEEMTNQQATKTVTDKLTIGNDGTNVVFMGAARREFTYKFTDKAQYNTAISGKESTLTFDGNTGIATYDDENLTLTISIDLDKASLDTDFGGEFPTLYPDVRAHYDTTLGYTCQALTQ